jgi:hypothetical protein
MQRNSSSWELNVTLNARHEHGDWMTQDAAIGIWASDLQRALCAFHRPIEYGASVLALFGLGPGKRSVHFDWIASSMAVLGSNLPEVQSIPCLPHRHEISADLLAVVYSWMVQDPYDTFQDGSVLTNASPFSEMSATPLSGGSGFPSSLVAGSAINSDIRSHVQHYEKHHIFTALQKWASNKFALTASKFVDSATGMRTLVSCFHASSPEDLATVAVTLISPHKGWPCDADHRTLQDWMSKTCARVKSISARNAAARIKGSVILYMPSLVDSVSGKQWKPSAPELKRFYEDYCGGSSDVSFVCMSPWEVLEVSEYLRSNVLESSMTRDIVTEVWAHCLPALNAVRGVQESIHDQRNEAKFFSYGWPDITRSHVPRVQAAARCASSVVRSVLIGCHYLVNKEDELDGRDHNLSCCLFYSYSVSIFDEISTFCQKLFDCLISSHSASAKDVLLLVLEFFLELFEEVLNVLKDPFVSSQRIRKLILDANVNEFDIDVILSSDDDVSHAVDAVMFLAEAFGDGLKQLKNGRKTDTFDQCESVAKCTISIVNSLLKEPDYQSHLSPTRRWRDDELWKRTVTNRMVPIESIHFDSHCKSISEFITTASFCGPEKNIAFPNGRSLDSSHHRSISLQCIETLLFFVCTTVINGAPSCTGPLPRTLKLLCRGQSGKKGIRCIVNNGVQKFQAAFPRLKKVLPQRSPPPAFQVKPPFVESAKHHVLTPHRRRLLHASGDSQFSESMIADPSLSDQRCVAPGLRVLHDVQVFEQDNQCISGVLSEDFRFGLIFALLYLLWTNFAHQMNKSHNLQN